MTDTNADNSYIYVFVATTIIGGLVSIGTALYFSLRCMRARGDIPLEPESLSEVVISPVPLSAQQQQPRQLVLASAEQRRQPLLAAQRLPPAQQQLQLA